MEEQLFELWETHQCLFNVTAKSDHCQNKTLCSRCLLVFSPSLFFLVQLAKVPKTTITITVHFHVLCCVYCLLRAVAKFKKIF